MNLATRAAPSYDDFLRGKLQLEDSGGFEPLWLPNFLFDFQRFLVEWALRKGRAALYADTGLGKALDVDTPVLTPTGFRPISDLTPGDYVVGADGKPTEVLGVYPQGQRMAFRVTFSDAASVVCDGEHLWTMRTRNDREWNTATLNEIVSHGLHAPKDRHGRCFIPMVHSVEFAERDDLPLHPYVLGCLIGDGYIAGGTPQISSADEELIATLNGLLPLGLGAVRKRYSKYDYSISRIDAGEDGRRGGQWTNPLVEALTELGLWGHRAESKFIPDAYKFSAVDTRLALLQGLFDTDGGVWHTRGCPVIEFCTVSPRLAADVQFLVQSLGGRARIHAKPTNRQLAYRMHPTFPRGVRPFRLARKAALWRDREKYMPTRSIRSVEGVGPREMICIKVAAPDGLFVVNDCIVTHNTPMQLVWAENVVRKTNRPVLILTPLAVASQTVREGEKFSIAAQRSPAGEVHPGINVVNYERLHYFTATDFSGVVCDESAILKSFTGETRAAVTEFMRQIPYRLLCTATPSPNDFHELGTSSEALGYLGFMDMLCRFFKNARNTASIGRMNTSAPQWCFRGHAEKPFWRWVCSWARALQRPSQLGFDDGPFKLPPLVEQEHIVRAQKPREGFLFSVPAIGLAEEREERRRTIGERCEMAAALVNGTGRPAAVWCHLNDEADLCEQLIPDAVQVSGRDDDDTKEAKFEMFTTGKARVLVTKPKIGAWGMNWQHCAHMVTFTGHSFEQHYQSIRRFWRFGQKQSVHVDHILSDGEQRVVANLKRKAEQAEKLFAELTEHITDEMHVARDRTFTVTEQMPSWLGGSL